MIRVSDEAKRLLGSLSAPDGEVLRLIPRSSEADGLGGLVGGLTFRHGRGEGANQIVQHDGRQVLRIERSVRRSFDGSSVVVVGKLSVVPPGTRTTTTAASLAGRSGARNVGGSARAREGAIGVRHEEFAERAGWRLEATADRLEGNGRRLGIDGGASKIAARARELRVAALLVHEEAVAVAGRSARPPGRRSPRTSPLRHRVDRPGRDPEPRGPSV